VPSARRAFLTNRLIVPSETPSSAAAVVEEHFSNPETGRF
jgi:hypothetical protein